MNFFLRIRTIALIHGNDGGLRRDSVECALSGSCRGRRKENLYEGSWREFEPCARFITPITKRRGGDPSLIYRDAQLEKAPDHFPRNSKDRTPFRENNYYPGRWNKDEIRFHNNRRISNESYIILYSAGIRIFLPFFTPVKYCLSSKSLYHYNYSFKNSIITKNFDRSFHPCDLAYHPLIRCFVSNCTRK